MPTYTFAPAPVLVETTGEFAIGATGVLRATEGGDPVPITDLNDSPLASVLVGPKGAHQAFKADIPDGILDFGSVLLVAVSVEAFRAGIGAEAAAAAAAAAAADAAASAQAVAERLGMVVIDAWTDPHTPRPALPLGVGVLWLCPVAPTYADEELDIVLPTSGGSGGGTATPVPDPDDPDAYVIDGAALVPDPNDPDAYIF